MTQEKAVGEGELSAPESFYTQAPPQQPQQPQQPQSQQELPHQPHQAPQPDHQIPTYNPGAAQYADHQGYAYAPPPTRPQATGGPAADASAPFYATTANTANTANNGSNGGNGNNNYNNYGNPVYRSALTDRLSALGNMAASPLNMLANKMGSESFLPATMDKECEKAARVLKGFCKHGIYANTEQPPAEKPSSHPTTTPGAAATAKKERRTLVTIPASVIQKAVGLAIFTTGRVGFHLSATTGSGVLIARLPDGSWSPASGIQIHSVGAGAVIGADIYDCVLVLNTQEALDAFRSTRLSLGSDVAVVAGPYGAGGSVDIAAPQPQSPPTAAATAGGNEAPIANVQTQHDNMHPPPSGSSHGSAPGSAPETATPTPTKAGKRATLRQTMNRAVYSYIKSRGIYAGVQVDGTIVNVRQAANTAFYGASTPVECVLRGEVPPGPWQSSVQVLLDAVRGAEGQPPMPAQQKQQYGAAPPYESWANAAPATTIDPGKSGYPTAPTAGAGAAPQDGGSEVDVGDTYVKQRGQATGTPTMTSAAGYSKAQEAADEAAAAKAARSAEAGTAPPAYSQDLAYGGSHDVAPSAEEGNGLPPAYVDDGQVHPGAGAGDSKAEH